MGKDCKIQTRTMNIFLLTGTLLAVIVAVQCNGPCKTGDASPCFDIGFQCTDVDTMMACIHDNCRCIHATASCLTINDCKNHAADALNTFTCRHKNDHHEHCLDGHCACIKIEDD